LRRWRGRLIAHFAERGAPFLKNGKLGLRPEGMAHSLNFPHTSAWGESAAARRTSNATL
jgi:hypothetical protein